MPWYSDRLKTIQVESYDNERDVQRDAERAVPYGWTIKSAAGLSGHINVGRTATAVVLTGGLSLLLGASRTKGKILVTWERDANTARIVAEESREVSLRRNYKNTSFELQNAVRRVREASELPIDPPSAMSYSKQMVQLLKERAAARTRMAQASSQLGECLESLASAYHATNMESRDVHSEARHLKEEAETLASDARSDLECSEAFNEFVEALKPMIQSAKESASLDRKIDDVKKKVVEGSAKLAGAPSDKNRLKVQEEMKRKESEIKHLGEKKTLVDDTLRLQSSQADEKKRNLPRVS